MPHVEGISPELVSEVFRSERVTRWVSLKMVPDKFNFSLKLTQQVHNHKSYVEGHEDHPQSHKIGSGIIEEEVECYERDCKIRHAEG